MSEKKNELEVLTFQKGFRYATVVTDGTRTKSFEYDRANDHASVKKAIAFLEARGYQIKTELSKGYGV